MGSLLLNFKFSMINSRVMSGRVHAFLAFDKELIQDLDILRAVASGR